MSDKKANVGSTGWIDLTIPNADGIRDFYSNVVGWKSSPVAMDGYSDYTMTEPESGMRLPAFVTLKKLMKASRHSGSCILL